jgi:hypothetical protein
MTARSPKSARAWARCPGPPGWAHGVRIEPQDAARPAKTTKKPEENWTIPGPDGFLAVGNPARIP